MASGPCLLAAGAFVCSFISLQVKLFEHHVPPLQVTAVSSGIAWLATSAIMAASSTSSASSDAARAAQPPREVVPLLLLRGLLGAATITAYYAAVEELPLPVAVALFFFHPVFALLLSAAVSRARVPPAAAASCALSVMGVLVIGWHDVLLRHAEQVAAFVLGHLPPQLPLPLAGPGGGGALPAGPDAATAAAAAAAAAASLSGPQLSLFGVAMGLIAAATNAAAFVVVGLIGGAVSPLCVCRWQHGVTTCAAAAVLLLEAGRAAEFPAAARAPPAQPAQQLEQQRQQQQDDAQPRRPQQQQQQQQRGPSRPEAEAGRQGAAAPQLQQQQPQQPLAGLAAWPSGRDGLLLGGVVAANFGGQLLLNAGFQRVDAGRGASVNTLQVLFANLWDVLLLHSAPCPAIMAGSGMIAAGVLGTARQAGGGSSSSASSSSSTGSGAGGSGEAGGGAPSGPQQRP